MSEIRVFEDQDLFTRSVLDIRAEREFSLPRVCRLGAGVFRFTRAVFPEQDQSELYAKVFKRDGGIGPHFDIYGDYIDAKFPWVGVYNLAGTATVTAAPLNAELTAAYRAMFPERTEKASIARRYLGSIAFLSIEDEDLIRFTLQPGTGMVIAQNGAPTELVHDVVPDENTKDGIYAKFIKVNRANQKAVSELTLEHGYAPLEEVIEAGLGKLSTAEALGGNMPSERKIPKKVTDAMTGRMPTPESERIRRSHGYPIDYMTRRID